MRISLKWGIALCLASATVFEDGCATSRRDKEVGELVALAHQTAQEPSSAQKFDHATRVLDLMEDVCSTATCQSVPESTIDDLIRTLPDLRAGSMACESLVLLGRRARRAIPAIESAIVAYNQFTAGEPVAPPIQMQRCLARIQASP